LVNEGEVLELDIKKRGEFFISEKHRIKTIGERNIIEKVPRAPYRFFFE